MQSPVDRQLRQALAAFCLGLAAALVYDLLRVLRRRVKSPVFTAVCDLLFSFCLASALFLFGFSVGQGRARVFATVFTALSAGLYFNTVGPLVRKIMSRAVDGLCILLRPLGVPGRFLRKKLNNFKKISFQRKKNKVQ